jgi:Iap family predicted aminopeptidase
VEWIALNGEENGGVGDAEYLRRSEDTLEDILFLINVDGAGQWLGANSVVVMGASQALEQQVRALHNRYPGMIWSDPWYESDHSAYLWLGVPVVPISSSGSANVHHLPSDTLQWVSAAKMEEVISFTIAVVESLQYSSPDWCRRSQGRGEG